MVQSTRASAVPVIVYIAPRGAIAGSSGMIIALSGHAAVMAPETAIGAASPERLPGRMGSADIAMSQTGTVLIAGERWNAELDPDSPEAEDSIGLIEVDGLELRVRSAPEE